MYVILGHASLSCINLHLSLAIELLIPQPPNQLNLFTPHISIAVLLYPPKSVSRDLAARGPAHCSSRTPIGKAANVHHLNGVL